MSNYVVPFGMYKGYPLDQLYNDKQYLLWFLTESNVSITHKEIHKELVNKLILSDLTTYSPTSRLLVKNNQLRYNETSAIERNKILSDFLPPNDIAEDISYVLGHQTKGVISNLHFFKDGLTIQFDYQNSSIENYSGEHFIYGIHGDLNDDFDVLLEHFVNQTKEFPNSTKIMLINKVTALGISEDNLIYLFISNGIILNILEPQPKELTTKNAWSSSVPF